MNSLGFIPHPRHAQAFVDYLQELGIAAQQNISPHGVEILVEDQALLQQAEEEFERFLAKPNDARYWQASWLLEGAEQGEANARHLSSIYRGNSIQRALKATGLVNKGVILLCTVVYFLTAQGQGVNGQPPFWFFETTQQMSNISQWWRWLAPAFIHFGIFHFLFNMSAWWIFGNIIERTQSSARLFIVLVVTGVIANVAQFFWSGNNFGGLSGVVYGVVGYLWLYGRFNPSSGVKLPAGLYVVMVITLILGFTNVLPFANQAHLGGFISGCILGALLASLDKSR